MKRFFESRAANNISQLFGALAEVRLPGYLLRPLIKSYIAFLGVDMSQVLRPPGGFQSFGDFFARRMADDARPVCNLPDAAVCPCDGVIIESGKIPSSTAGGSVVIKKEKYKIGSLIGDATVEQELSGGGYILIYLHPRDYHRVHSPLSAKLRAVRHIPGTRYPMAAWADSFAERALGKNERVVFELEMPNGQLCVLCMVAAFGVGNIECRYLPSTINHDNLPSALKRGEELAAFRLGSTVAMLWSSEAIRLDELLTSGRRVLTGQRLGIIGPDPRRV